MARLRDLILPISADASGFRSELQAMKNQARADSMSIGKALDGLSGAAKRQQGNIKSLSREFLVMGGEATKGLGMAAGAAQNLLGAFAGGGALGLGIMAATQAMAKFTEHLVKTRQEAQNLEAIGRVYGVTKEQVESLSEALDATGVKLEGIAKQRLAVLAKESNLSAQEVAALAAKAKDLAAVKGTSIETELTDRIKELGRASAVTADRIASIQDVIKRQLAPDLDSVEWGAIEDIAAIEKASFERLQMLEAELVKAEETRAKAYDAYTQAPKAAQLKAFREADAAVQALRGQITSLEQETEDSAAAIHANLSEYRRLRAEAERDRKLKESLREAERKAEEERRKAAAREAADLQAGINLAQARGEKETAINLRLTQRLRALDALKASGHLSSEAHEIETTLATEQAEKEKEALVTASLRARYDAEAAHRANLASLTETQVDDLEEAQARQLEAVRRRIEDEVLSEEEGQAEIARIREYYGKRIAAQADKEARAAEERIKAEEERRTQAEAAAYQSGIALGTSFMHGLKDSLEEGSAEGVVKGVLGLIAGGLMTFGGPMGALAGFGLSSLLSFFAEGGLVRGPGGPRDDRILAALSNGEYVAQASAVKKFGVPFLDSLNQGILDLSKLPAYASGGFVGSFEPAAPAAAVGTTNIFQIKALDPKSTLEVIASRLEPASVQRGITGADARAMAYLRGRMAPPRTGRR